MSQEAFLLLIGGGIGFVSSLLTTVVTTLLNQLIQERVKKREKLEKVRQLSGLAAVHVAKDMDQAQELAAAIEKRIHESEGQEVMNINLDFLIGFLEGMNKKP